MLSDFVMGPSNEPLSSEEITRRARGIIAQITDDHRRNLKENPPRGLRRAVAGTGWQCPNCGSAHGPDVATCPEPPRGAA
jgi:hypothetical protein